MLCDTTTPSVVKVMPFLIIKFTDKPAHKFFVAKGSKQAGIGTVLT